MGIRAGRDERTQKASIEFAMQRPDKLRVAMKGPEMEFLRVSDGESTWAWFPRQNEYVRMTGAPVHADPADINSPTKPGGADEGFAHAEEMFLYRYRAFAAANSVKLLRDEIMRSNGAKRDCYVIEIDNTRQDPPFKSGRAIHTWWVDKVRFVILREDASERLGDTGAAKISRTVYTVMRVDEPVDAALFTFVPPKKAKQVEHLIPR